MQLVDLEFTQKFFKKRKNDSNKGSHGHGLLVAGSYNKMGAAIIASRASLRSGIGLITVNIPESERFSMYCSIPESMISFRESFKITAKFNSIAIGPGIGINESTKEIVESILKSDTPHVIDADAITIISNNKDLKYLINKQTLLTPHPKEFDRLFGIHENLEDRLRTASEFCQKSGSIILLKGHISHCISATNIYKNSTGNYGLAKGGSGDALTGILLALLSQQYSQIEAAILAMFIHGLAADYTLETQSPESMLITDVIENLGMAFKKIQLI